MDRTYLAASLEEPTMDGFLPYTLPSDNELQYFDRYTVISRSRDLCINNALAKAIADVLVSHVIGGGLTPQVVGNPQLEDEFKAWCDSHSFGNHTSFNQLQELVFRTVLMAGDVLVNMIVKKNDTLAVQLIEPERITNPGFTSNTALLRNGVELDEEGTPIRYHILSEHPAEPTGYNYVAIDSFTGDLKKTWLVFKPNRPDQHRGVPIFTAVMDKLKMLDRYLSSELLAAVIASNFCVFVETPSQYSPIGEAEDKTLSTGETIQSMKMRPGMIVSLAPGEKVTPVNPTRPNPNLEPYITALSKLICSGVGLSHEVVTMAFSANYSASKAAMAQSWKTVIYWRKLIIDSFCTPVFDFWCAYNGYPKHKIEWQGSNRVILDDAKEVSAAVERVNLGISSRKEECEELRGKDWDVVHQYLTKERELGYAPNAPNMDTGNVDGE